MAQFGIGQPVERAEDPRLLTGKGRYTADLSLPEQAWLHVVRSPMASADIRSISTEVASQAEGVLGVFTAKDFTAAGVGNLACLYVGKNRDGSDNLVPPRPALAGERVYYVGEPVAIVVAETANLARDAAELVEVDYEERPAVTDTAGAAADDAPQLHEGIPGNLCFDWALGDEAKTDAAFEKASHVVSLELVNNRLVPNPMECRAAVASYEEGSGFSITCGSQGVHLLQGQFASILGVEADAVQVRTGDVGGGFGMKIFLYPEYIHVLFAARALGRPVRWISERTEAFLSDTHGRDHVTRAELALDADAQFLGLRVHTIANLGAQCSNFGIFVPTLAGTMMLTGCYQTPAVYANVLGVYTNTPPVDAYRGAGRPEAAFVVERIVDKAARQLGLAPDEIRRRNFIRSDQMPYTTPMGEVYDTGNFVKNMDDAIARSDWAGFEQRRAESERSGRLRGIGMASYIEACSSGAPEEATIEIGADGRARVLIGTQSNGQGHETAYRQIVSERLELSFDQIDIVQGDTATIGYGGGTGGSRSVPVGGAALSDAAMQVIERGRSLAADQLEASLEDIEFQDGRFRVPGTDLEVSLGEASQRAADAGDPLAEAARWTPPAATFPNGTHVCEVEVAPETGALQIVRYTVVDDFGTVINPLLLEGQVHGGIVQGLGQALLEHTQYDSESGQLLSASFMDYAMPRADDAPHIDFTYNVVPSTTNALGMKGAGEAGAIGAPPAIINALVNALQGYGVEHVDMPATPERVWSLIDTGSRRAA